MLWYLYAGHHHPFFEDGNHLITAVYEPVDVCVPPLLSYTRRSAFLCILKGNTSLGSKLFLLGHISEQFFSADQLLLQLFQDPAQEIAAKAKLHDFKCQTSS